MTVAVDWSTWEPEAKARLRDELAARVTRLRRARWTPYPWQVCPAVVPTLGTWLLFGGRGVGKTDGGSNYVLDHVNGPACDPRVRGGHRVVIIAPTIGDAVESCVRGPSGLKAYDPRVQVVSSLGGTVVRFPNGAEGVVVGARSPDDVERLRAKGANRCLVWIEEAGACRMLQEAIDTVAPGMRLGERPHFVMTTTPRAVAALRKLLDATTTVITRGRTADAHHLPQPVRDALVARYAGTRLARQELEGEMLEDVEGALWSQAIIDASRVPESRAPDLARIVVAVDPNAGGPDEAGIVVVGLGRDLLPDASGTLQPHLYVLHDGSGPFTSSAGWARHAVALYHQWAADAVVAEVNNGGDMVGLTIKSFDQSVRYRDVRATRGKARRAEPVVGLYEQGRVHHVGDFPRLEEQQTTWVEGKTAWSPDRMDALVWGATDLGVLVPGDTGWRGGWA